MPSQLHEALLELFRNRPTLAPELLRDALRWDVPSFSEARLESADLTDVQPAEYRADLVVVLSDGTPGSGATGPSPGSTPLLAIIVEVQLSTDEEKRFVWPAYVATLRKRLKCPVCLLVVAANKRVARWASKTIDMGGSNRFTPFVLGPDGVPEITDEDQACEDPELAVLSAIAHGHDKDVDTSVRIALAVRNAIAGLDEDRASLYYDVVFHSLNKAAQQVLRTMNRQSCPYLSTFARSYYFKGAREGVRQGFAAVLITQLGKRFGPLTPEAENEVATASTYRLKAIAARLFTAGTLREALGPKRRRRPRVSATHRLFGLGSS